MPKLEYFVVADDVAVDQTTNRVSVFNILDEIHTTSFPAVHPKLVAVSGWLVAPDEIGREFLGTLRVMEPDGTERTFPMAIRGQTARHRLFHRFEGLPIRGPGAWSFEIQLDGKHQASHEVTVFPAGPRPGARPLPPDPPRKPPPVT